MAGCGDKTCQETVNKYGDNIKELYEKNNNSIKWKTFWPIISGLAVVFFILMSAAGGILYSQAQENKALSTANKELIIEIKAAISAIPNAVKIAVSEGIKKYDNEKRREEIRSRFNRNRLNNNANEPN